MKENTPVHSTIIGRRKALAGIGILSLFSGWMGGFFAKARPVIACAPPAKKQTMRVLSQDGQLMEVEVNRTKLLDKKISDKDLREWVKKK